MRALAALVAGAALVLATSGRGPGVAPGAASVDAAYTCTQGLLLADYVKAIITGQNLPDDLAAQAATSPLLKQYDTPSHFGPLRRGELGSLAPGASNSADFDLSPGHYVMICNIAGHYSKGMAAEFTVK